jgi:hypothetical protein
MVPAIHEICPMDSSDLAGPMFHPLVATSSVFSITSVVEVVKAHSVIGATACTDCWHQNTLRCTFQQISPRLLLTNLCTYRRGYSGQSKSSQAYSCTSSKHEK